ncbi:hypothetical protein ACNAN0_07240 [Agrilactobacillus fermenti]|uniref:hypothetical protein n=1 Tax=Agrilactobacillus fermenti TaxID=2586909 RepID=UPI003A5C315F
MQKTRKWVLSLMGIILMVILSGCQTQKLSTNKKNYQPDLMATVIKGHAGTNQVKYQVAHGKWQEVPVRDGAFAITIPRANQTAEVAIKSGSLQKQVTVNKATVIMPFAQFLAGYTMASQATQQTPLQLVDNLSQKHQYNGLIAKDDKLMVRGVVSNNQLMGLTLITKTSNMKQKKDLTAFATQLATLATVTGADGKTVLKQFGDKTKSVKNGKTTIDTIKSKGVKFDVAFSDKNIYVFVTK